MKLVAFNYCALLPNTGQLLWLSLLVLADLEIIEATRCVVGKWRPWSNCMGNCDFAQRVRNRDVLRPPFPERHAVSGDLFLRECPHLYEVENCSPKECEEESPFAKLGTPLRKDSLRYIADNDGTNETTSTTASAAFLKHQRSLEREKEDDKKRSKVAGIQVLSSSNANRTLCGHRNSRCCKLERRVCPDGRPPKLIIRWHRQKDEPFCRPFHYPYCGPKYESFDAPIVSENICTDLCFSSEEKTILSSLRII